MPLARKAPGRVALGMAFVLHAHMGSILAAQRRVQRARRVATAPRPLSFSLVLRESSPPVSARLPQAAASPVLQESFPQLVLPRAPLVLLGTTVLTKPRQSLVLLGPHLQRSQQPLHPHALHAPQESFR